MKAAIAGESHLETAKHSKIQEFHATERFLVNHEAVVDFLDDFAECTSQCGLANGAILR
jgi:hypothetical protein